MKLQTAMRDLRKHANSWMIISIIGAAVLMLPIFYVFVSLFYRPNANWQQIKQFLLKDYVVHSLELVFFTGVWTVIIGVSLAWFVSAYDFPMKRFFRWALVLPLAIPPYIAAYTYTNMMSYTGIVQKTLRTKFELTLDQGLFDMMTMRGAVFIFTMFLYPYVYLITRSFLERQSASYIENARLLGKNAFSIFVRVVLPIARPAIIGGSTLVVFEVLNDYGVTSYFGIHTISTAIFQTWFGMYDVQSAMRLAAWLMVGAAGVLITERILRRNRQFSSVTSKSRPLSPKRLKGFYAASVWLLCTLVLAFSFLIPLSQLIVWATWTYKDVLTSKFLELTFNTLSVALTATFIIMVLSLIVANVARFRQPGLSYLLSKGVTAGYSIPGAIIAIGVLGVCIDLDHVLAPVYELMGLGKNPLVISLSIGMGIFGYVVRFMATGYNAVESGFEKVGLKYVEASRILGIGLTKTFFKVDLPLIRGSIISGFILTFVEIIKELPITLLLRPFNFETLATKVYQYAGDEQILEASVPSLFIIALSIISVLIFHQLGKKMD
ncbi:iron ABC transporter permease [Paenibacillus alginolyticus]|uniref:ABC transporter permease n=1 Tax=Paenibacillus alginolyticus TaxID=59839 RepID=UPI00041F392E|nr:iron ABC transporter permease [Paenibacillus alginolyticus]MCY9666515.1 iron ABC transporter permease [Paenibacillus alginolyticus]